MKSKYDVRAVAFLMIFLTVCLQGVLAQNRNTDLAKPNVVLIYIDDLGYGDVGAYGATQIKTPNVDKLAAGGMLFTNGHCTSATCTPSRYGMMTGQYPWRKEGTGILEGDAPLIIPTDKITLPKVFQSAGYKTAVVGKWHLGLGNTITKDWNSSIKPGPNEVGFDYSYIFPATADRVPTVFMENDKVVGLEKNDPIEVDYTKKIGTDPTGSENPELLKLKPFGTQHSNTIVNGISRIGFMKGGMTARWTDEELTPVFLSKAIEFIENSSSSPFFLFFSLNDIHAPRMPSTMFKGKSNLGLRGDAILQMDWAVGEISKKLKALNIEKNTIIIFSSDNGPVLHDGYQDLAVARNGEHKPAGPYKGGKYTIFEGGTRVPFIVNWPAEIKSGRSDALISQIDFLASFASFFGKKVPKGEAMDSQPLWSALTAGGSGRSHVIEQGSKDIAILAGDWKYIPAFGNNKNDRLFNIKEDISESKNVIQQHPAKAKELQVLLEEIKNKK
jgi:arylsulfatase A